MSPRILMCPPTHFEVSYEINPWMQGQIDQTSATTARRQWDALHDALAPHARLDLVEPGEGLPDMTFTANAGVLLDKRFVLSRFRHDERRGEEALFERWFAMRGYEVLFVPEDMAFEGAGDALLDRAGPWLWMGHGHRSDAAAVDVVGELLNIETVPLRLVDPRFYHLDTCLCPLEGGTMLYYPGAFDEASQAEIARRVPEAQRIAVDEADARRFACNAVNTGQAVFVHGASDALRARLAEAGFESHVTPLGEFLKSGGGAKCLTLRLDEAIAR